MRHIVVLLIYAIWPWPQMRIPVWSQWITILQILLKYLPKHKASCSILQQYQAYDIFRSHHKTSFLTDSSPDTGDWLHACPANNLLRTSFVQLSGLHSSRASSQAEYSRPNTCRCHRQLARSAWYVRELQVRLLDIRASMTLLPGSSVHNRKHTDHQ